MSSEKLTIALTSCGRPKLLAATIESLDACVTDAQAIANRIVYEDSRRRWRQKQILDVVNLSPGWSVMFTDDNNETNPYVRHKNALVRLYAEIRTPLVFHCEDDWIFLGPGFDFLDISRRLLADRTEIGIVTAREYASREIAEKAVMSQDLVFDGIVFREHVTTASRPQSPFAPYQGFTLNPGMRRAKEMRYILERSPKNVNEIAMGEIYRSLGLKTYNFTPGFCRHLGDGFRSTTFFANGIVRPLLRASKNAVQRYWREIFATAR